MEFKAFYKQLKSGDLPRLIWIHGEEPFYMDQLIQFIKSAFLNPDYADFNWAAYSEVPSADVVQATVETLPFFDARRLLFFKETRILKGIREAEEGVFLELLKEIPEHAHIIFSENDVDQRKRLMKHIKKSGVEVHVKKLTHNELERWIDRDFKERGITADSRVIHHLIHRVNYMDPDAQKSLYDVRGVIQNIAGINRPIAKADIDAFTDVPFEHNIFKLVDAVASGDIGEAMLLLGRFVESGESEIKILALVSKQLRTILKAKVLLRAGHTSSSIAGHLSMNPYAIKKACNASRNFSESELRQYVEMLKDTDQLIKSTGVSGRVLIEKLLGEMALVHRGVSGA